MKIQRLTVKNFRNIEEMVLEPGEGVNVFYGNNAQGKTNLVEAVYLLTGQKSFRQTRESDFVRFGESSAQVEARFFCDGRTQEAKLVLGPKKSASLNDLPIGISQLTGRFFAVVFSPTELSLIKEGPGQRRLFLDNAISQVMPRYLKTLADLNRVVFQRNSLLYEMARHPGMSDDLLAVWDRSLMKLSYSVINARCRYLARLSPYAGEIYSGISGGREALEIRYQCSFPGDWGTLPEKEGEAIILTALENSRREDLKNGYTTLGPHRDDMELQISGISARSFGSQGQQRSCALTLKLAECKVIQEVTGETPVILLDDVLSELDKARRDYFLSGLHHGQLFITCCDRSGFRSIQEGVTWRIKDGQIRSRRVIVPKAPTAPKPQQS